MRASTTLSLLAIVAAALVPSGVAADAVGPPTPRECPAGSAAVTNHCGTVCAAVTCASDAECGAGQRCEERALCMESVPCGGWGGTYSIAHGACASGGTCAEGVCESVRSCGPGAAARDAGSASDAGTVGEHVRWGCGCNAAGGPRSPVALVLAGLAAWIVRRVRRR